MIWGIFLLAQPFDVTSLCRHKWSHSQRCLKCDIFNLAFIDSQATVCDFTVKSLGSHQLHCLHCEAKVTNFWTVCIASKNGTYRLHNDVTLTHFPSQVPSMWKIRVVLRSQCLHIFVDFRSRCYNYLAIIWYHGAGRTWTQ